MHFPLFEICVVTAPLVIWVAGLIAGEAIERAARWLTVPAHRAELPCPFPKTTK